MILHRDTAGRGAGPGAMPTTPDELARSLRRVRTRQGLRLEDVSARTGLPLHQLQAIEAGRYEAVADRVAVLRTLRHYADHLGLPGDRYVLILVDHWPAPPSPQPQIVALHTGQVPAGAPATATFQAAPPTGFSTAGIPGLADTGAATAMVPAWGPPVGGMHDTGVTDAVPSAAFVPDSRTREPRPRPADRSPLALRLGVALVALAIVAGVAGLVIHRYEPKWLSSIGITTARTTPGGGGTTSPSRPASPSTSAPRDTKPKTTAAKMTVDKTSPSTATLDVSAPSFVVKVAVASSDSWVQVTGPATAGATPGVLFSGLLSAGQSKTFTVDSSLTVEIGSVAAQTAVTVGSTLIGTYDPAVAPYTMTFQTATS
ncbi:MAG: helix-turn-helix domain-containing protein [Actinomycetota bacterium]|nr:helix-turn-helix domain-containing protein [Actinomycetota bacterium]